MNTDTGLTLMRRPSTRRFAIVRRLLPALFLVLGCASDFGNSEGVEKSEVPVMNVYDGKIVYTTDMEADPDPFREDCRGRGGVFNECGDICEPGASICAEVCAYTCELDGRGSFESDSGLGARPLLAHGFTVSNAVHLAGSGDVALRLPPDLSSIDFRKPAAVSKRFPQHKGGEARIRFTPGAADVCSK